MGQQVPVEAVNGRKPQRILAVVGGKHTMFAQHRRYLTDKGGAAFIAPVHKLPPVGVHNVQSDIAGAAYPLERRAAIVTYADAVVKTHIEVKSVRMIALDDFTGHGQHLFAPGRIDTREAPFTAGDLLHAPVGIVGLRPGRQGEFLLFFPAEGRHVPFGMARLQPVDVADHFLSLRLQARRHFAEIITPFQVRMHGPDLAGIIGHAELVGGIDGDDIGADRF
ncbi:MAG: hypothetical protein BWX80_02513 [Candidatus Hydrogenedentes bacterium ADurb.Bin101]|nr:MAG: hypothetical protein BWX80_02513 [Candidatus Hydrogenedentes bacterium ADurb.Bin101]